MGTIGLVWETVGGQKGDYSLVLCFLVLQPVVLRPVVLCSSSPTPCFLPQSVVLQPNSPTPTRPSAGKGIFLLVLQPLVLRPLVLQITSPMGR